MDSNSPTIVVVGSCNTDLISYTKRLPKPGETVTGQDFLMAPGGKGANQCVAAAKLGARTGLISKVGDDTFGNRFIETFMQLNVNINFVKIDDKAPTGTAAITVDENGENSIIIFPGANLLLSEDDIRESESLIRNAKIVICQGEISEKSTRLALELAKKHKVLSLMNAAPASDQMDEQIYKLSDIFCVNQTEASTLTGVNAESFSDAEKACDALLKKGCNEVIITLGSKGALYANGKTFHHITCPTVDHIVDTTGAGDAFVGSLAHFMTEKSDSCIIDALEKACKVASYCVQFKGTQISFPFKGDLVL